jgi:hypothetical protein
LIQKPRQQRGNTFEFDSVENAFGKMIAQQRGFCANAFQFGAQLGGMVKLEDAQVIQR